MTKRRISAVEQRDRRFARREVRDRTGVSRMTFDVSTDRRETRARRPRHRRARSDNGGTLPLPRWEIAFAHSVPG